MTSGDSNVASPTQLSVSFEATRLYENWDCNYDHQLLIDCAYRSPTRLAELVKVSCVSMRFDVPWLDLGAGTGLVGRALADAGLHLPLIAVDLSRAMLSQITAEPYVACAAIDVLDPTQLHALPAAGALALGLTEHVVDLTGLFAACAAALPVGAPLLFSYCPLGEDDAREHSVFESFAGLIAHSRHHVTRTLTRTSFAVVSEHDGPGYTTARQDVAHRIVVAQRR